MATLILDDNRGGYRTGLAEVLEVPVPPPTETYTPVPNKALIDLVHGRVEDVLGLPIRNEEYILSGKGQQMFGVLTVDTRAEGSGTNLAIGMRNSYDRSMSIGIASGAHVSVCSNKCFDGDSMRVLRKHTTHVWRDVCAAIDEALRSSLEFHKRIQEEADFWSELGVNEREGYELIGRAWGEGLVTPRQASVALQDWKTPRYDDFAPRNAWSLYNCFTEGMKKGPARTAMTRYTKTHDWFREAFGSPLDSAEPALLDA